MANDESLSGTVDVVSEDTRWEAIGIERLAREAITSAIAHLGLGPDQWEVSLLACDDHRIAGLNAEFRGKAQPTNVLSWPSAERAAAEDGGQPDAPDPTDPELGDIAIAYDTCAAEAAAAGKAMADHVTHLIVHGTLHLLGYDHIRDGDAALMERIEAEILGKLGLPDPYWTE